VRIAQNDLEGGRDLFLARAAADIEKIRRAAAKCWMMSMVAMASPAPFTRQAMCRRA